MKVITNVCGRKAKVTTPLFSSLKLLKKSTRDNQSRYTYTGDAGVNSPNMGGENEPLREAYNSRLYRVVKTWLSL